MLIDEQIDHGNIIIQEKVEIENWPIGFYELQELLARKGGDMLVKILPDWIKGKIETREQNHDEATFTKKVEKTDGFISLEDGSYKNYLKYLAYEDWPKTFFEVKKTDRNIRVIIKKADYKNGVFEILRVVPEGKSEMDYKSFLNGLK